MVRPEYQDWYPWVTPAVWYRAAWLAEIVLRQRQAVEPSWEYEPRVPAEAHFIFHGGAVKRPPTRRTRRTDFFSSLRRVSRDLPAAE